MALIPDKITEKSFPIRLRRFDPSEVKGFLELLARGIIELQERGRQQDEKIAGQEKELVLAADDKKSFEDVIDVFKDNIENLKAELSEYKNSRAKLTDTYEKMKMSAEGVQKEREKLKVELGQTHTRLSEVESKSRMSQAAVEELRKKLVVLEAENRELKTETQRYEQTLSEARQRSDDLLEKSRQDADRILAGVKEQIDRLRNEAAEDIVQLKEDIEKLANQRQQIQNELRALRALLNSHLDRLNDLSATGAPSEKADYGDLFQKINFTELDKFEEDELRQAFAEEYSEEAKSEDNEENLRSKLEDGGVAYLSDE